MTEDILKHNREFVENGEGAKYATSKFPSRKLAIVTCMDTRLIQLLPAALGIGNGEIKIIKNAGGMITDQFDSAMRSLLVAIYELGVEEIMIIGHTDCGVQGMDAGHLLSAMRKRGVKEEDISVMHRSGIDLEGWLTGFEDTAEAVRESVKLVKEHPLMAPDVKISGYIIDTATGRLTPVE